jgi:hypothetical protein
MHRRQNSFLLNCDFATASQDVNLLLREIREVWYFSQHYFHLFGHCRAPSTAGLTIAEKPN